MTQKITPALRLFKPNANAKLRLFCFPYSGGSAQIFKDWHRNLPDFVEVIGVQMPGRAGRFRDTPYRRMNEAVNALYAEIVPFLDKPCALYGHSLGCMIAYEVCRRMELDGHRPRLLAVSGLMAPEELSLEDAIYHLPDREFKAKIREFNGTPKEVLEHEELMDLVLPTLKADFEVADTYEYEEGPMIQAPILVHGGDKDPHTNEEGLYAWEGYTTGNCDVEIYPGDHFFLHALEARVMDSLAQHLVGAMKAS